MSGLLIVLVQQFNIRLYLFVCMANHFHLVFEIPEANCSKFMHILSKERAQRICSLCVCGFHTHLDAAIPAHAESSTSSSTAAT
jgi:REP element-mobilizing transposase RayT